MMSRRNVISVCVVLILILILTIMLVSSGNTDNNAYDNQATNNIYDGTDDMYKVSGDATIDYTDKHGENEAQDDVHNDEQDKEVIQDDADSEYRQKDEQIYIVRDIGDGIAIYRYVAYDDGMKEEFYDYAVINTQNYPDDIAGLLRAGIELHGDKELYEFLQAYSS